MHWKAVLAGAATDVAIAALAATVPLPAGVRWPAFAALAGAGLLGGYVAGRLASGSWRSRLHHGLTAGLVGGAATWWSFQPGTPSGALWSLNYLVATSGLPPQFAAHYDTAIGVAVALAFGALYVAEGAVASVSAPGGEPATLPIEE
jgi:hypothetical protein